MYKCDGKHVGCLHLKKNNKIINCVRSKVQNCHPISLQKLTQMYREMGTKAGKILTGLGQSDMAKIVWLQLKPFPLSWDPVCSMLFTEWKVVPSTFGAISLFIQCREHLLSHLFQREFFWLMKIREVLKWNYYLLWVPPSEPPASGPMEGDHFSFAISFLILLSVNNSWPS